MRRLVLAFLAVALLAPMQALGQVTVSGAPEMPPARGIATRAKPLSDPSLWASEQDYPAAAVRAGAEGGVAFVLTVEIDGRVSACNLVESTGSIILNEQTCALLKRRGRFAAAIQRNRKPGPDRWAGTMNWKISASMRPPPLLEKCYDCGETWIVADELLSAKPRGDPKQWLRRRDCPPVLLKTGCAITVMLAVRRNGTVRGCKVAVTSGSPAWDRKACALVRGRARFKPERDDGVKGESTSWEHSYAWPPTITE